MKQIFEMLYSIFYYIVLTLIGVFFCVSNAKIAKEAFSPLGLLFMIAWGVIGLALIINFIQEVIILRKHNKSDEK